MRIYTNIYKNHTHIYILTFGCVHSRSVTSDSLQPHGLQHVRLLYLWHFPGKNTRAGCHFFFLGNSLTQGSEPYLLPLLHWEAGSLPLSYLHSHIYIYIYLYVNLFYKNWEGNKTVWQIRQQ